MTRESQRRRAVWSSRASGYRDASLGVHARDRQVELEPQEVTGRNGRHDERLLTVVSFLRQLGDKLIEPQSKALTGEKKLRELRPSGGQSTVRLLYARVNEREFVILGIGPESMTDAKGFRQAVARAKARAKDDFGLDVQKRAGAPITVVLSSYGHHDSEDHASPMAKSIDKLKTHGELVAEEQLRDEEFAAEWERLAFARAVAVKVIEYRADHGLSQRDLARQLGVPQPQIARLEAAEHQPGDRMLRRLTTLGMEFTINYTAADREPRLISKPAKDSEVARVEADDSVVRYSAA